MKKTQTFIAAFIFILVAMSAFVLLPISFVGAAQFDQPLDQACTQIKDNSAVCKNKSASPSNFVGTIVNTLLFVVGGLSVVMIIIGGLFYVTSQGDSGNVTKAKNTVLYSVIGLIVSLLAYAIVNWVLHVFG